VEGLHGTTQLQTKPLDVSSMRDPTTLAVGALGEKVREGLDDC